MRTRPTGDCASTACRRAPTWLWTILLHRSAALTHIKKRMVLLLHRKKKHFGLMHIIRFYMKRADLFTHQCPTTFCLTHLECAEGFLVMGHYAKKHLFLPQTKHRIHVLSGRELLPWAAHGKLLVVSPGEAEWKTLRTFSSLRVSSAHFLKQKSLSF